MKKLSCFISLLLFTGNALFAQVGINADNSECDPSAMLDVKSTTMGMLVPRMTAAQRNLIVSPANGLLIFCTDNNQYYTNKGTSEHPDWMMISSQWLQNGNDIWYSTGNIGIGTSAPHAALQLSNTIANRKITFYEAANNDNQYCGFGINNNTLRYQVNTPGDCHVFYAGNGPSASVELMRILGTGTVGIGTSVPASSAVLDVSSTTKGFLPPRMTTTQRDAIAQPVAGLLIYNTSKNCNETYNGSSWVSNTHYIGESYGGGIVYYVYEDGKHGLIAAISDQSTGSIWHNGTNRNTGTHGNGINAGAMNTALIVAEQMADNPTGTFAAKISLDYSVTVGNITYGDWYLPSRYELNLLWEQRNVVGGFTDGDYWSSSEWNSGSAWIIEGNSGFNTTRPKDFLKRLRSIRAF